MRLFRVMVVALLCILISSVAPAEEIPLLVGGMAHGVDNINALVALEMGLRMVNDLTRGIGRAMKRRRERVAGHEQ